MITKLFSAAFAVLFGTAVLPTMMAREIMEKAENLPRPNSSSITAEMTIYKGGEIITRKLEIKSIRSGKNDKILATIVAPFNMKVLMHTDEKGEDQQWLKQENGKVKKIIASDREKPFVNSHIFFEDLKSRQIDDYEYELLGAETVEGYDCHKIQATPKPGKSIYEKAVFYIVKSGEFAFFAVQIDIYHNGYFFKKVVNDKLKKVDGIITPEKMTIYKLDKSGQPTGRTEVETKTLKFNSTSITESMFSQSNL
jgi:hypothetical protein